MGERPAHLDVQLGGRVGVAVNVDGNGARLGVGLGVEDNLAHEQLAHIWVFCQVAALLERHGGAHRVRARVGVVDDGEAEAAIVRLNAGADGVGDAQLVLVAGNHVDDANLRAAREAAGEEDRGGRAEG